MDRSKAWRGGGIPDRGGEGMRSPGRLETRLVAGRPDGPTDLDAERADLGPQAASGDPQELRRLHLIAPGVAEHARQERPLHHRERLGIQVLRARAEAIVEE